ncbi:MAG: tetraacyldisaccharide 4'-kinase [Deltaproteobacteria bacterium]|nr:tetraacyldisaccharide 4'-kinase [Deltaproteobacteria bacterium]
MKWNWSKIHGTSPPPTWNLVLAPLSMIYGLGAKIHMGAIGRKKKKILPGFVASVGNLTTGGTGKTPAVLMLARWAAARGHRVAVLSRGYGGRYQNGVLVVSDPGKGLLADPRESGDEPFLLASRLKGIPVIVSKDRFRAGMLAHEKFGTDFFLLDDGFQHLNLHRDLDMVLLDAEHPFGNGHLLPRGPLREPVGHLERADAFILTRSDRVKDLSPIENFFNSRFPRIPLFKGRHVPEAIHFPREGRTCGLDFLKGKRIAAFAGIARPETFLDTLSGLGAIPVSFSVFADHHPFNPGEIRHLLRLKKESGAQYLVTTEKDWVRIKDIVSGIPDLAFLRIAFDLSPTQDFFHMMEEAVEKSARAETSS